MNLDSVRPVWAEVNLDNLAHNIREVRRLTDSGARVTAVVKANGYGHGSKSIARTFLDNGADRLAVAMLTEALELRRAGIKEDILVLGYTPRSQYHFLIEEDIIQTIYIYEDGEFLAKMAENFDKTPRIHIKVDSGMGRLGFLPEERSILDIVKLSQLSNLEIEGIYSHFAKADEADKSYSMKQYENFNYVIRELKERGLDIKIKHVSNSAAIIDFKDFNLNMVRGGIMIYGMYPSEEVFKDRVDLKPAMKLKARVAHVKTVPAGTGISYGQTFVTEKESKIATIPIGYADGYTRMLTGQAEVLIKGKRAKIVGKICMDQCMVDVSHIDDVKVGDELVLFGYEGDEPRVEELASKLGTINYEITCMVGRRVPRVYKKGDEIVEIVDYLL